VASKRVEQVMKGIKSLTASEKTELATELSGNSPHRKAIIEEELRKAYAVHTTPAGTGGCACCGR